VAQAIAVSPTPQSTIFIAFMVVKKSNPRNTNKFFNFIGTVPNMLIKTSLHLESFRQRPSIETRWKEEEVYSAAFSL
jgi:hypothetical protein